MPQPPNMSSDDQKAYDEALRRIEKYSNRGNRGIFLKTAWNSLEELHRNNYEFILDLRGLRLSNLPESLAQLTHLRGLDLSVNRFAKLPDVLVHLEQLWELDLSHNRLTELPEWLGQLSGLMALNLTGNELTELPKSLAKLTQLRSLTLSGNELTELPEWLGQFKGLRELKISHNPLVALPQCLDRIKRLRTLDLSHTRLTVLPESLRGLKRLKELSLDDIPSLSIPAEVLRDRSGKGPHTILNYYFAHRKAAEEEGTEPLMEAKVLVLGEASVGKSCLIAALTQGKRRSEVPDTGTRGIVRQLWEAPVKDGELLQAFTERGIEKLRLNCWDFGGQEIYHSAHTLFLTTRAMYLIVISKRDSERQNNVDYWLRMAASFGGPDAVIYVVVNKCDEEVGHPPDVEALRLRHPRLRGFVQTSCENLRGIPEARQIIVREALRLDGVRQEVARTWLAVKRKLEKMQEHTLTMAEWAAQCGAKVSTPEGQRELLHLCDRLGTVRYFPTTKVEMVDACETAILNPEWVTLGIYALLDDEALKKRGGLLDRPQMTAILKLRGYPTEHERIIEEVMRRFDLLYDSAEHGTGHRMLIPLMLPELMPAFAWSPAGSLEFRFQYQVMPAGLLPAFMARMHLHLSKTVPSWRHGCVLELRPCKARVIADSELKRVLISVEGPEALRREVLDTVRFTFSALHGAIEQLPVEELIPVPGRPDAPMLKYSYLRSLHWKGIREIEVEGTAAGETITVNVREALDGVRGQAQRERDDAERARSEERRGVGHHFIVVKGDYNAGDITMKDDHSIHARDIINSQVGQTLTNCNNMIQQQAPGEQKDLLTQLQQEAEALIDKLPEEKKAEAAGDLEQVVKGATSSPPVRRWYSVSAEGLLDASKFVKDFSGNIAGTVGQLGKLLWPDFKLTEKD